MKAEPDPEDSRVNDDEREALCDLLGGIHEDGWPGVEADVLDQRGLHPDQVATEWLQDYAQSLVDTQKGQQNIDSKRSLMSLDMWLRLESAVHRIANCTILPAVRIAATWANEVRDAD